MYAIENGTNGVVYKYVSTQKEAVLFIESQGLVADALNLTFRKVDGDED